MTRTYQRCVHCGRTEVEPFTPARFDAMQECERCGNPCCQDCGENELNDAGTGTVITCRECPEDLPW